MRAKRPMATIRMSLPKTGMVRTQRSQRARPSVVARDGRYLMWYTGQADGHSWIGLATGTDGVSWQRHGDRPVLSPELPFVVLNQMCADARHAGVDAQSQLVLIPNEKVLELRRETVMLALDVKTPVLVVERDRIARIAVTTRRAVLIGVLVGILDREPVLPPVGDVI